MKVIIVGGVAGGASCAARLRRLDENAEILMVERGPYVSYANCGLPYHVGGIIKEESSLLVATAELFRERFAIDVRTNCEAIEILPKEKKVKLRDVRTGEVTEHAYDKLVLSPGAASIRPPLPGIDLPGIFHVRTVPDARQINEWIAARGAAVEPAKAKLRAVVVGGGFIGLEMAENLVHRGFEVDRRGNGRPGSRLRPMRNSPALSRRTSESMASSLRSATASPHSRMPETA